MGNDASASFAFLILGAVAIWVGIDANKRDMNGILWGILVFLLCIVFLRIYLIMRTPKTDPDPLRAGVGPAFGAGTHGEPASKRSAVAIRDNPDRTSILL